MTSILKDDDKVFTMYKQYKELLHKDVEKNDNRIYGTDQLAAQLTVAHMLDHLVCLFKKNESPTVRKVNNTWKETFDDNAEAEIMRNNAKVTDAYFPRLCKCCGNIQREDKTMYKLPTTTTSTSSTAEITWGRSN